MAVLYHLNDLLQRAYSYENILTDGFENRIRPDSREAVRKILLMAYKGQWRASTKAFLSDVRQPEESSFSF